MGLSINTNVAAMNSYRNLSTTQNDLSKSLEKLSSGLRINRAADDAAGLAISEGLRSQIGGTKQAVRNAQDGISVVQTAEGALTETHSILQRMRTLSVQGSNEGSLSTTAKGNIKDEMDQLKTELTRIADTTQFNGKKLLDGKYEGSFQVGANNTPQDQIKVKIGTAAGAGLGASGLGVNGVDVTTAASDALTATTVHATATSAGTATLAATVATLADFSKLNGTISVGNKSLDLKSVNYSAATDVTSAQAALSSAVAAAFGTAVTVANAGTTGQVFTGVTPAANATAEEIAATSVKYSKASGATQAIDLIDKAITEVSKVRSGLGAVQNRFDHTINNLNVSVENLSASESRIRDTDMAQEMVQFTRSQILSQAGTAMLSQAKNLPQSITQLLQ